MGFFAWLAARRAMKMRRLSQPFSVAVADSMTTRPGDWEYTSDEKCLVNERANIAHTLPQDDCRSHLIYRYSHNGNGSNVLAKHFFGTPDLWLLRRAYRKWHDATALDRENTRETYKARAILDMAA